MTASSQTTHMPWKRWITEFFVIAVGVAVALAGDAAWEAGSDARKEDAYVRRLSEELERTASLLAESVAFEEGVAEAARTLSLDLNAETLPPTDSLTGLLGRALGASAFRPALGTADALVHSGDLALFSDDELKIAVAAYIQAANRTQQLLDINTEALFGQFLIEFNRRVNRVALAGEAQVDRVSLDWGRLTHDPAFHGDVATISLYARNRVSSLRWFETDLQVLRETLARVSR